LKKLDIWQSHSQVIIERGEKIPDDDKVIIDDSWHLLHAGMEKFD